MNKPLRSKYLEALDVPAFLYAEHSTEPLKAEKISTQCLIIETQNNRSFCQSGTSQDFLLKMFDAIGLKPSDIKCISINADDLSRTLANYNAKTVLFMSKQLTPTSAQHFATHHPSEILSNGQLKREAWEVLKKIKACLS